MADASQDTVVKAVPQRVWNTLVDFERYPEWTSVVRLRGQLVPGGALDYGFITRRTPKGPRHSYFAGNIKALEPPKLLSWEVGLPGLLHLRFEVRITGRPDGAMLRQAVSIGGLFGGLARRRLTRLLGPVFERLGKDLQQRLGGAAPKKHHGRSTKPRRT